MAVLALAGCQTETFNSTSHKDSGVFTATIEDAFGGESKTSLDSDGNIRWKQGDQVSIFVGSTLNEQYQVTDDSDGKTEATMSKVTSDVFVAGTEMDSNVALYPYTPAASIAKNSGAYTIDGIVIPADQDYTAESFGNGAFPMVAVTGSASDRNLRFKNIFGGLKLQLKGTATISSISVTGNNGELLCGAAQLSASSSQAPSISFTDGTAGTVTLYCGQGVALNEETATSFVIALPPVTMTAGFTVRVRDTAGWQMEINTDKSQTITRSTLLKMPSVTYEGTVNIAAEPVDLGLSVKWAAGNLCDNGLCVNPWDYGDYYAWGETEPKSVYMRSTYLWGNGTESDIFTKYCSDSSYGDNGYTDTKTVLDADDDVARVKLGDKWRMPVFSEWKELEEQCTWTWFENYHGTGVNGMLVVGPNGNSIFLPAAGQRYDESLNSAGSSGLYWSSVLFTDIPSAAVDMSFSSSFGTLIFPSYRFFGESVRPVYGDDKLFVDEISFTKSSVSAVVGGSVKLKANVSPSDAYDKSLGWSSSAKSVATVDQNGNVTALAKGKATITAMAQDGSGRSATCEVIVSSACPAGAVDLGITTSEGYKLYWATSNLSENGLCANPWDFGDYYAWGETDTKSEYSWSTYKWSLGSRNNLTKYCPSDKADYWGGSGSPDNKTVLVLSDDAAHAKLGGNWRMPTYEEWVELNTKCTRKRTSNYSGSGIGGLLVTGNNNSIFLPATTKRDKNGAFEEYAEGTFSYYWSSSLALDTAPYRARTFFYDPDGIGTVWEERYFGFTIRPVFE